MPLVTGAGWTLAFTTVWTAFPLAIDDFVRRVDPIVQDLHDPWNREILEKNMEAVVLCLVGLPNVRPSVYPLATTMGSRFPVVPIARH